MGFLETLFLIEFYDEMKEYQRVLAEQDWDAQGIDEQEFDNE